MINMINISPVLSTFCSECAQNRGNVNHVNLLFVFVSSECVHCVSYSIQREALKLRCAGQASYFTLQSGKFGQN